MSMQEVKVLVENSKEVEAIIAALRRAEERGQIDFPFDVEVEEWLSLSEQAERDALVDEYMRAVWQPRRFPFYVQVEGDT